MAYTVNGVELEADDQGYLRDANTGEGVAEIIAAAGNCAASASWSTGSLASIRCSCRRAAPVAT